MKPSLLVLCLFCSPGLFAQSPAAERQSDFTVENTPRGTRFTPKMPPLIQKPGAPPARYEYFWEFGDGSFSREREPVHVYAQDGEYLASLDATNYYDDGKKPKNRKNTLKAKRPQTGTASVEPMPDGFETKRQAIAMLASAKPKAGEEITCIISYRNLGKATTDGRLHLFFNEKKAPATHFRYVESRPCFGETEDNAYGSAPSPTDFDPAGWAFQTPHPSNRNDNALTLDPQPSTFSPPPSTIIEAMLQDARGEYRESRSWRFTQLKGSEARNFFISLAGTSSMVRDTNTTIHLAAVLEPFDPALPPERFTMEIQIVASHDPNAIAVSDNRVNYRFLGSQKLDYKVDFQNNGEGPASTIELLITVPEGMKLAHMRPLEWYPKCPLCSQAPKGAGCLDTASTANTLRFTFRNIYLPGSQQADVGSRDSTRGWVRYRIEPEKDMPKLPFRKQAKITFDKNKPIYTNFSKTRFKPGLSPGPKVGYAFPPDSVRGGYYFLGVSFAPYKPWRIFPQIELLTGLRERTAVGEPISFSDTTRLDSPADNIVNLLVRDSTLRRSRGFVSLEIPLSIRKNLNRFVGVGAGISGHLFFENGKDMATVSKTLQQFLFNQNTPGLTLISKEPQGDPINYCFPYKSVRFRPAVFADVSLGSVRAGPSLNVRAGGWLHGGFDPFIQLALEMKL